MTFIDAPKLADFVQETTAPHRRGRVFALHVHCPHSQQWLRNQPDDIRQLVDEPWASVLIAYDDGSGASVAPLARFTVIEPFYFMHPSASFYFREDDR